MYSNKKRGDSMKTFIILLLTFGLFEANAKTAAATTKAQPQRNVASASTESAGNCSLIDVAAIPANDHSCQGTWVATRSGDKILFCCQYQDKY
jgi:hypothetical protein